MTRPSDASKPTPEGDALLAAYVDGELDPASRAELEARLSASPEAGAEVAELVRLVELVGALPEVPPPPDFADRVIRKARRHGRRYEPDRWFALWMPFQVLSIVVILIVAAIYMMEALERSPVGTVEKDPPRSTARPASGPGPVRP